jgi:hypothetical protein
MVEFFRNLWSRALAKQRVFPQPVKLWTPFKSSFRTFAATKGTMTGA